MPTEHCLSHFQRTVPQPTFPSTNKPTLLHGKLIFNSSDLSCCGSLLVSATQHGEKQLVSLKKRKWSNVTLVSLKFTQVLFHHVSAQTFKKKVSNGASIKNGHVSKTCSLSTSLLKTLVKSFYFSIIICLLN